MVDGSDEGSEGRVGFDCFDEGTKSTSVSNVAIDAVCIGGLGIVHSTEIDVLVEDGGGDALSRRKEMGAVRTTENESFCCKKIKLGLTLKSLETRQQLMR